MKTIAVVMLLCFVGALALTDEQKAKLAEYKAACITETGVDPKAVDLAKSGEYSIDNPKVSCFAACIIKKIGIMDADGTLNIEAAKKKLSYIPQEQVDDVINKCKDVTGENDCEKAANLLNCFKENKTFRVL